MVHLDLQDSNESALRAACELADQFDARVIGTASGLPNLPVHLEGMVASSVLEADYEQLKAAIDRCEARFREALKSVRCVSDWRAASAYPAEFLATEARAADLVIVGRPDGDAVFFPQQSLDIGDAVMQAGRPMLIVPANQTCLPLHRALLAWKDTPQARRAAAAALPLLARIENVMVVETVSDPRDKEAAARRVADVAAWLQRHGIAASASAELTAEDAGDVLRSIAAENAVDLIVAGAYGRSRLREWVFGGVTRNLLQHCPVCTLLMH
jgi:nucleotide-binding universal stress UspA family protein